MPPDLALAATSLSLALIFAVAFSVDVPGSDRLFARLSPPLPAHRDERGPRS